MVSALKGRPGAGEGAERQHPPLLAARRLTKVFPGVRALDGVDFTVRAGEISALMGENGAGKSTLLKILTGVYRADDGEILLDGKHIAPHSPIEAQRLGVSAVHQEVNLIPGLSIGENICLGRQPMRFGRIDWRTTRQRARQALMRLKIEVDVSRPLGSCSVALQQLVAIARALDVSARVLILDEPTSSLDAGEVDQLFRILRRLRDEEIGIVFVTHFIDQVYAISDRITVLRNGKLVGDEATRNLSRLELVQRMIGRAAAEPCRAGEARSVARASSPGEGASAEAPLLAANRLGRRGAIDPIDLDIRRGEVVGLAGLLGSGRTETARLLFGLDRADTGQVSINGRKRRLRSPRTAIRHRFGMLPEDRKTQGMVAELSVRENIVLALQARRGWLHPLRRRTQRRLAERFIRELNIATTDAEKPIGLLSGGNQQKAILARWLATDPVLLILDEPTRGVDVGARAEIERLVAELRRRGMAILFISAELDEVVRDSQRVIVLRDRRKIGELAGEEITEARLIALIAGESP